MKHVALFMTASLRSSPAGTYTPALVDLVERLSNELWVTVFTVVPPTGETDHYQCGRAEVIVVSVRHDDSIFRRAARFVRAFMRVHRARPVDLVHGFWATPGGLAAVGSGKLAGVPSIVTLQGGEAASIPSIGYGNMSRVSTRALTLWVCRHAARVTALTKFQGDAIRAFGLERDLRIIPYGAPPAFFCRPSGGPPTPPIKFLHVADLNRVKDQEMLLRAFQIISGKADSRLTIAGRDLLDGRIQRLAREMGIRDKMTFLGYVHHEHLPPLYFSADFLLHTSLFEAQGVVISEACAAGTVVCGTRVGLVADLEGTCTVAASPGDARELADTVLALIENPARYLQIRSAGKAWAEKHDAAWTGRQFLDVYKELLNF